MRKKADKKWSKQSSSRTGRQIGERVMGKKADKKRSKQSSKTVSSTSPDPATPIQKPDGRDGDDAYLEKFRSKKSVALASVESNTDMLPHHRIVDAKDFVRLHPDPGYWSPELCFISVPIIGQKKDTLHLIDEELRWSICHRGSFGASGWLSRPCRTMFYSFARCPPKTSTTNGTPPTSRLVRRPRPDGPW